MMQTHEERKKSKKHLVQTNSHLSTVRVPPCDSLDCHLSNLNNSEWTALKLSRYPDQSYRGGQQATNRQHSNIKWFSSQHEIYETAKVCIMIFLCFHSIWQHLVTSPHIVLMRQTFMWPMNTVSLLYFYLNHIGLWHNAYFISYVSGKQLEVDFVGSQHRRRAL